MFVYLWIKTYINLVQHYITVGHIPVEYDWVGLLISSYSKVTHVLYGHVMITPAASLNICTLVNGYDA